MQKDFSYGVIPIFKDKDWNFNFLLIHQKTKNKHEWGYRGFPKGHAEIWETWIQAAQRELTEEVGIQRFSLKKEPTRIFNYQFWQDWIHYDKTVSYWIGFVKDTSINIQEREVHEALRLNFYTARATITHKNMRKIFEEVGKYLGIK